MKVAMDVKDKAEGDRVKVAMGDETARALMNITGALMPLSVRDRKRVMAFVLSGFEESAPEEPR